MFGNNSMVFLINFTFTLDFVNLRKLSFFMSALGFEQKLYKAIINDDIETLKNLHIRDSGINFRLYNIGKIKVPKENSPFHTIYGPTPLILAVLFQKPKILAFLLETCKCDFDQTVDGWTVFHYACCTSDPQCLQILLKYEYIQQNIDKPIIDESTVEGQRTTALHIAVSNGRHAQAILLTQPLPAIQFNEAGRILDDNSPVADESSLQQADALQVSAHGNTPLHIAAFQNDWDMCQIILNAVGDFSLENSDGQTAVDIARFHGYDDLAEKIEAMDLDPIEALSDVYLTPLTKDNQRMRPATISEVDVLKDSIKEAQTLIESLSKRIEELESSKK